MSPQQKLKIQPYFLQIVLLFGLILMFLVYRPYISVFLLSFVLAVIFRPLFSKLMKWTGDKTIFSALFSTFIVVLIILIPLAVFTDLVLRELSSALQSQSPIVNFHLPSYLQQLNFDFKTYLSNLANDILNNVGLIFSNIASFVIYTILAIITLVYLFKDGPFMRKQLFAVLPLTEAQKQKMSDDVASGVRAVIGGYMLVSIIQGVVSGFGFWIFGIPNPALWGFVALFAAFLPSVGTSIVNIPAVLYLLLIEHHVGSGLGLLAWYIIAISIIDNYIGPRFISGRVKIHPLLILFSILGGLKLFGSTGFIIAPLLVIFFWSVLQMAQQEAIPAKE